MPSASSAVTAGTNATATQYNNLRSDALLGLKNIQSNTDGATITFNLSLSNTHTVVLGGNRTLAFSNVTVGQWFYIELDQGASGSRTVTWPSGIKWPGGTAPTLSTAANAIDGFVFKCTGSGAYTAFFGGFGLS